MHTYHELFILLISGFVGLIGTSLTQYLKEKVGINGTSALMLTVLVAAILATAEFFLTQSINITISNIPDIAFQIFGWATVFYNLLIKGRKVDITSPNG